MLLSSRSAFAIFGLVFLFAVLAMAPSAAPGQTAKDKDSADGPDKVSFETADGVKLHGHFYKSAAKDAPAVIMLHNIGETSAKEKWIELAKALQATCAVLTFDFRGHGASVDIDPTLYRQYQRNLQITKGTSPTKAKLDYHDISKDAYTVFINDIAAAKSYLERTKNDLGQCNTQNTIVIGVEQSATLAAIWANSEWSRYKVEFTPLFTVRPENRPEGQYLSALVCLSITPKLGTKTVNLANTLALPCKQNNMPALFICADGEPKEKDSTKDKEVATKLVKDLKFMGKKELPRPYTLVGELAGAGKLKGVDLLLKSLKTADNIKSYIKTVVDENRQEWTQREFAKSKYAWKQNNPNVPWIPARVYTYPNPLGQSQLFSPDTLPAAVDRNLIYDSYAQFAQ